MELNVCQVPNYILSINILKIKTNEKEFEKKKTNILYTYVDHVFVKHVDDHQFVPMMLLLNCHHETSFPYVEV